MASKNRGACEIDVKTSDESCADEMLLKTGKKCDLCKGNQSKYTCPKCMLRYCGVDCYKSEKHRKCSEDFYKDNVMRELKGMKPSDETKKQTMEILKRMMENEKNGSNDVWNDDESVENLANRLAGVDLDTASFDEMYSRLTEKEKKLFEGVVQSGEIEILDLCTPWWMHGSDGSERIKEVKAEEDEISSEIEMPEPIQNIAALKDLLPNKKPSEKLAFSVAEVIALYCFLYRVYNGELKDSLLEVTDTMTELSPVLSENYFYETLTVCLKSLIQRIKGMPSFKDHVEPVRVSLSDLQKVVTSFCPGRNSVDQMPMSVLCISDIYHLFTAGLKEIESLKSRRSEIKKKKNLYHKISRKLLFMASWLTENTNEMVNMKLRIESLQKELCNYWDTVMEEKKIVEKKIDQLREKKENRLIEEL